MTPTKNLPSTAVGRRRLLKLAGLLEANAKNSKGVKFDLGIVCVRSDGNPFERGDAPRLDCRTTACAIGLWSISGKFPDVSFRLEGEQNIWPVYDGFIGRRAAEKYFSINNGQSFFLFIESAYPRDTPTTGAAGERAVAKRIRDFVTGRVRP